jgi:hypothetical protein
MSRADLPSFATPDVWIDESHGLRFHTHQGQTGPTGCLFVHRDKRDPALWCMGGFDWASPDGPNWTLVSMQPFHVEPSIHCLTCDEHGFIRDGKWIPA